MSVSNNSVIDFGKIFSKLEALSVGYGPVFKDFQSASNNYPPHNIVRISDNEFHLELAVAGFKKSELTLEECEGALSIKGEKADRNDSTYQFNGIASRSFSKVFRIAEYFEVQSATAEDGILTVKFVKNVPDEAKPKRIAIN